MKVKSLSHVQLLAIPWTAAYQAPLSMGFSRQEYWSGVPLPSPGFALVEFISVHLSKNPEGKIQRGKLDWQLEAHLLSQGLTLENFSGEEVDFCLLSFDTQEIWKT